MHSASVICKNYNLMLFYIRVKTCLLFSKRLTSANGSLSISLYGKKPDATTTIILPEYFSHALATNKSLVQKSCTSTQIVPSLTGIHALVSGRIIIEVMCFVFIQFKYCLNELSWIHLSTISFLYIS